MAILVMIAGVLLMLGGAFVPGEWWIELFRPMPAVALARTTASRLCVFPGGVGGVRRSADCAAAAAFLAAEEEGSGCCSVA